MKLLATVALGLGLALSAAAAQANTVTLNETLDLSTAQQNYSFTAGWRGFGSFSPAFSFELAAGDSLDYTIDFKGEQTLTLTNPTFFWAFSYATSGESTGANGTGTLTLLDTAGAPIFTTSVKTDDEGAVHFGQQFSDADFGGLPGVLTFGGLRYVGTLDGYDDPGVTVRTYADPQVLFNADGALVGGVPEPAAWTLMIAGFGLAGIALRRRHQETRFA